MRVAYAISLLGVLVMSAALIYGFSRGAGWREVEQLVAFPWFNVSLIDVYVGFALFSGWIAFREAAWVNALVWIVLVMLLGNLVTCLYVVAALRQSRGNWSAFWLGNRRGLITSVSQGAGDGSAPRSLAIAIGDERAAAGAGHRRDRLHRRAARPRLLAPGHR